MAEKSTLDWIALVLVIVGGINWGLYGLVGLDLVDAILGGIAIVQQLIYVVIGLAALYLVYLLAKKKL